MSRLVIRDAVRADAVHVGQHLRPGDRRELARLGRGPGDVLLSFDAADVVRTIEAAGEPVAIFGRCPGKQPGVYLPWMLATPGIDGVQRPFVLACKPELQQLRQGCGWLYNLTHRENTAVVRWLRWLGFNFEARGHGPRGEFRLFWLPGVPNDGPASAPGGRDETTDSENRSEALQ